MHTALAHRKDVHRRLRNPPNAVVDLGIDLKRQPTPIARVVDAVAPPIVPDLGIGQIIPNYTLIYPKPERRTATIKEIQRAVCSEYKVDLLDLLSHRRTANIVAPRQVAMWLARHLTPRSMPHIGRAFAGRDHTTVLHAVRKIERLRTNDASLKERLDVLIGRLSPLE